MKLQVFFILSLLIFYSCTQKEREQQVSALKAEYQEMIEGSGATQAEIREKSKELAAAYLKEAPVQADTAKRVEYMYMAAELYEGFDQNIQRALEIYEQIVAEYPNTERAKDALFKQGFLYHERVKNLEKARAAYESFIEKYPNDELTDDAEKEIKFLGLTPEEVFEILQQQADSLEAGDSLQ